ncbi:hypothetical protein PPL_01005 [Heterostelium album PN500]|uniref:Uncharacterized protein n=1 Tax=Heterostelium pallidum (strain ATCC 26659 / Pp 5 / PN500) TaxID=670386 RepID=D3AXU8_HETP5|nr:hypothetical protein PPL_01005 [Heterostelium album PN500]EFA85775.1 hypothetical protein PPL_01005 [Heterostelium album PN500]|eukprot:XP_020437881.1 hypothetical protein PPL_01005 [Heterostelium album PN500]
MNFKPETIITTPSYYGITDSPAYIQLGGTVYCIHHGYENNHELWYTKSNDLITWTADAQFVDVQTTFSPAAIVFNSIIYGFHNGSPNSSGDLNYVKVTGNSVTQDNPIHGLPEWKSSNSPSATVFNNLMYLAYHGPNNNGKLLLASSPDGVASNWSYKEVPGITITGSPSMATFNGKIYIVFRNTALGNGVYVTSTSDTNTWTTPTLIPNVQVSGDPKLTATANKLVLVHRHPTNAKLHVVTCNNLGVWSADQVVNTSDMSQDPGVGVFNGKVIVGLTISTDAHMHLVSEL